MTDIALFVAVFLACLVEAVEATTIVVAAGSTRDWRSALTGTVSAMVVLAVVVAIAGPAIMLLPLDILRLVVGGLLLVFGLQWLRKAVLRASGHKALHDEGLIYQRKVAGAQAAQREQRFGVSDWYGFTLAFKGVLLEGLEVVFIVLTFATNQGNLPVAIIAAAAAIVIIATLGAVVRGPLSRVPENALKFVVGIMLAGFGAFWGAEGAGALWPGSDAALLVIVPAIGVYCLAFTLALRRQRARALAPAVAVTTPTGTTSKQESTAPSSPSPAQPAKKREPGRLAAFGLFWYDFVIGDDWQVAVGVVIALALVALLHAWIVVPIALAVLIAYGTLRAARA